MVEQQRGGSGQPLSAKGLLGWLYDMTFTRRYAPRVIKAAYWMVTAFLSLLALVAVVVLLRAGGPLRAIVGVILIAVAYLLYLATARILLEVLIVIFAMGEDLRAIRVAAGAPGVATPPMPGASTAAVPSPLTIPARPPAAPSAPPVYPGPHLEEIIGYGEAAASSPTDERPSPEGSRSNARNATPERQDYPPEADGPPWIT